MKGHRIMRPGALCAFLLTTSLAASSAAQTPGGTTPSKDDALSDTARELFLKGAKASEQQKWDQCRATLLAAWGIKKHPQIAGNLAACEVKLGFYRDAAEHIAYFLRETPANATAERNAGQAVQRQALAKIAAVTIKVTIEGAAVTIDGQAVGASPLQEQVFVEPGRHTIEARREGYPTARASLDAQASSSPEVTLKLEQPVLPPPPPPPPPPEKRSLVPAIVAGGVAVGAAAAGVGLFVASSGKKDAVLTLDATIYKDHGRCVAPGPIDPRCAEIEPNARSASAMHNAAVGMFVGAGVLAAGALVYLLWPATKATKAGINIHAAPVVGAGHGGLIIGGAF
jgi:hypothetical protein